MFYAIAAFFSISYFCPCYGEAFTSQPIPGELLEAMEKGNTWSKNALVPAERLRLLTVQHIDFQGQEQTGQIIVLDVCEDAVLNIFQALYQKKFPIQQIKPMHYYNGDDRAAMAANNTSCYVDRNIIGSTKKSLHACGVAIDINPIQNPFVTIDADKGIATYDPQAGIVCANRLEPRLGKSARSGMAEEVIEIFAANGFYWWGGYWDMPIDYQHFQLSAVLAELYLIMKPQTAKSLFNTAIQYFNNHKSPLETDLLEQLKKDGKEISLLDCYTKDQKRFEKCLKELTTVTKK